MRYSVMRPMAFYLLVTAGMAMLFAFFLQLIWVWLPHAPATIVLPGMVLPAATSLQAKMNSYSENGITIEAANAPRFLCARVQFQRNVFTILDNATIGLMQQRNAAFPFGIITDNSSTLRPQREPISAQGGGERELPPLLYIRDAVGVGTGGLVVWMEGAHRFLSIRCSLSRSCFLFS